jgi:hypothetical protein
VYPENGYSMYLQGSLKIVTGCNFKIFRVPWTSRHKCIQRTILQTSSGYTKIRVHTATISMVHWRYLVSTCLKVPEDSYCLHVQGTPIICRIPWKWSQYVSSGHLQHVGNKHHYCTMNTGKLYISWRWRLYVSPKCWHPHEDHNMNPTNGANAPFCAYIRTVIVWNLLTAKILTEVPMYLCSLTLNSLPTHHSSSSSRLTVSSFDLSSENYWEIIKRRRMFLIVLYSPS